MRRFIQLALLGSLIALGFPSIAAQTIELPASLKSDSLALDGESGGKVDSKDCGFISKSPTQVLAVRDRLDFLRLKVKSQGGQPTLLIKGPSGRFCILGEKTNGYSPQHAGIWMPGNYQVFVGDLGGQRHRVTLELSRKR
ncbi:MAG: hypothetical protein AAGG02_16760 [Cyanobacteria bacterium P01_H01_bin.15]